MRLYELIQAYDFDEVMPVIAEMFPGTAKYQPQLSEAYALLRQLKPVESKKEIRYRILSSPDGDEQYMGAMDKDFDTTWEVCLGKNLARDKGVDLSDIEMIANTVVNVCLISRHPKSFDKAFAILNKSQR